MLDNLLIACAVFVAIGGALPVWISQEKERQTDLKAAIEKEKADSVARKYREEIQDLQSKIQRLTGTVTGQNSRPVLRLGNHTNREKKIGVLIWDNHDGEDAAQVISGYFVTGQLAAPDRLLTITLKDITIPAKTTLGHYPISFPLHEVDDMMISIHFTTLQGEHNEIIYATYDGNQYREAIDMMIHAGGTNVTGWREIDPGFPLDHSKYGNLLKTWLK